MSRRAVIASAVRTPIGRRGGGLSGCHPADLLALVLREAVASAGLPQSSIGQILVGCVSEVGEQTYNIARTAALAAGFPAHVPGTTMDAQCGSSQQAVNLGAALIAAGAEDIVIAAGVESMSRIPLGTASSSGPGDPLSPSYRARYEVVNQGESAERIADNWRVTRRECDEWAALSQRRAARAWSAGHFAAETRPVPTDDGGLVERDEGLRPSTPESLAALKPAFREDGRHTAGNSSQISDGAAAVVLMAEEVAVAHGARARAALSAQTIIGVDPVLKLTGPIPATRRILDETGRRLADIDRFEVNEAFASVVLAWLREFPGVDDRLNVNGGAIALGHPVGATGARLITTALHELERSDLNTALVTMCCGGGLGTATLIERLA